MQSLYTRIDKTRALLQPVPVDLHERRAAGHDDPEAPLAFHDWDWNTLLLVVGLALFIWTAGFLLIQALTPFIVAVME